MPDVLAVLRWSVDEQLPQSEADVTVWLDTGSQWIGNCKAGHWRVYGEPKGQVTHWARWPPARAGAYFSDSEGGVMKYWSDDGEHLSRHETAAAARKTAEADIEIWRDDSEEHWLPQVADVSWGAMMQQAKQIPAGDGVDYVLANTPLGDVFDALRQCIDDQRRGMDVLASDAWDRVREAWDKMEAE